MSIFASRTQTTIPIPGEDPHTVTIRKLTGRELEDAQAEHLRTLAGGRAARGWSAVFQRILAGTATPDEAAKVIADPLAGYDRTAIVRGGLVAWSYPEVPGPATIADLDDEALEWIARAILRLTKPLLFEAPADAEAEKKSA